jgi:hypothetical protein
MLQVKSKATCIMKRGKAGLLGGESNVKVRMFERIILFNEWLGCDE